MNIHLRASFIAKMPNKKGELVERKIEKYFNCWQTSTTVTNRIVESRDCKKAYIDWVRSEDHKEKISVYAENDIFQEGEPIGEVVMDHAESHLKELEDFLNEYAYWDIEWFSM